MGSKKAERRALHGTGKQYWRRLGAEVRRDRWLYLLLLPQRCIEHIVVHELAHLLVPNHGPRFYAVMDKHFPDWKQVRKETSKLVFSGNI